MLTRLYIDPERLIEGDTVVPEPEQANHLIQVMRLRDGAAVQLFDGRGNRFAAILRIAARRQCLLEIGGPVAGTLPASPVSITLLQGVAAGDRMDWVVEKAVELGIATIVPIQSARSTVKLTSERAAKRVAHWQRIAISACMQCGRDDLPEISPVIGLEPWLAANTNRSDISELACVLDPLADQTLTGWLNAVTAAVVDDNATAVANVKPARILSVAMLIGPESGLGDDEIARASARGFVPVRIGPRVLRTETAGVVAAAMIQARFGDLADHVVDPGSPPGQP